MKSSSSNFKELVSVICLHIYLNVQHTELRKTHWRINGKLKEMKSVYLPQYKVNYHEDKLGMNGKLTGSFFYSASTLARTFLSDPRMRNMRKQRLPQSLELEVL